MYYPHRCTIKVNLGDDPRPNFFKWETLVESIPCHVISEATIKNVRKEQDETTKMTTEIRFPPRRDLGFRSGRSYGGTVFLCIVQNDLMAEEDAYIGSIKHHAEAYSVFLGTEFQGSTADYV